MRKLDDVFVALSRSRFRQRMRLSRRDAVYLAEKTLPVALEHAREFIRQRLAPAAPPNDGKQTPMRGHPAFVAQHATATCCRKCLRRWHGIAEGRELTAEEQDYVLAVLERWLQSQPPPPRESRNDQRPLF